MSQRPNGSQNRHIEIQRKVDKLCDDVESKWARNETVDVVSIADDLEPMVAQGFVRELLELELNLRNRELFSLESEYKKLFASHPDICRVITDFVDGCGPTQADDDTSKNIDRDFVGKDIGDYKVSKRLGGGGFGVVYLARDKYLPRDVVIKIPLLGGDGGQAAIDSFLDEARHAVLLDHPNILKIMHVGVDSGLPYIVQTFFEGGDLQDALRKSALPVDATVRLVAKISDGIGYAHSHRIVHRDLKPANIMIDKNGEPVVADFGLSLREPQLSGREGELVGTIRYMSPEQVRGESHRLDGRTDIWSIGVILYYMLTGNYPFDGSTHKEISESILLGHPRPPQQWNPDVPVELGRICLKCLCIRVNDRYRTAYDLADELNQIGTSDESMQSKALVAAAGQQMTKQLIPKGLAAFDGNDRGFFLDLLPGPKDRNGLPESIRFWKERIENEQLSSSVNLLFGPSGCGKSSLVSAGIIPALSNDIVVVPIESTPLDTEVRFLKALRNRMPSVPLDLSLPDLVAEIRRGKYLPPHKRLLVVVDQFEQWLHANPIDEHSQLINALRQCDGARIQALVLAREDFWMAITRFFKQLDIELVERKNFASVDLFSKRHTKEVLTKFGQAYGNLPGNVSTIPESADKFLDSAVEMLAENNTVICVKSALFAETFKNESWEPDTIREIGDTTKIGITFLDQALGQRASNPKLRFHRERILNVLESLLPDPGVEIKGNLRSVEELAESIELKVDDSDFQSILKTLDNELRLITPTEPDLGRQESESGAASKLGYYQLTHDYLVPAIREWLVKERGTTLAGRSRMRLKEMSRTWNASRENRFLPGLFEFLSIRRNVPKKQWTPSENKFMKKSYAFYSWRIMVWGVLIGAGLYGVLTLTAINSEMRAVQAITCEPDKITEMSSKLTYRSARIVDRHFQSSNQPLQKLRAAIALAQSGRADSEQITFIIESIEDCPGELGESVVVALSKQPQDWLGVIEGKLTNTENSEHWCRLQWARIFLAPDTWDTSIFDLAKDSINRFTLIDKFDDWHGDLEVSESILNHAADSSAAISCIYQCIGLTDKEGFSKELQTKIVNRALSGYENPNSSASVHSSCRFLLNRWQIKYNNQNIDQEVGLDGAKQWWMYKDLSFIRVDKGVSPTPSPSEPFLLPSPGIGPTILTLNFEEVVAKDFYICATEIPLSLFDQFHKEEIAVQKDVPWLISPWPSNSQSYPTPDCPVGNVTYDEAVLFCNWLSRKAKLKEVYRKTDRSMLLNPKYKYPKFLQLFEWEIINDSTGFRLPYDQEFQLAGRANVITTEFFFGPTAKSDECLKYCWSEDNAIAKLQMKPVATSVPNPLGLFDICGNATEFRSERRNFRQENVSQLDMVFGGSVAVPKENCDFGIMPRVLAKRKPTAGFRLVLPVSNPLKQEKPPLKNWVNKGGNG